MSFKLPRLPETTVPKDLGELSARLRSFASDVVEFMRLTPSIEYKTITTVAGFPIYVKTMAPNVVEVRRARTYETVNSANVNGDVGIGWQPSPNPLQPGIIVTELSGLTANVNYTVVLAIQGTR